MAEDDQRKQGGAGDRDVMGSLPRTRPARRSARRDAAGAKRAPKATPKAASKAKPKAAASTRRAAGTGRAPADAAQRRLKSAPPRKVPPAGYATPKPEHESPGGTELVSTAARAAGELAQLGVGVGRGVVKRLLGK